MANSNFPEILCTRLATRRCRVLERGVRACPQSAKLWTELLLAMEKKDLWQAHGNVSGALVLVSEEGY